MALLGPDDVYAKALTAWRQSKLTAWRREFESWDGASVPRDGIPGFGFGIRVFQWNTQAKVNTMEYIRIPGQLSVPGTHIP